MLRRALLQAASASVVGSLSGGCRRQPAARAFVTNEDSDDISVIDTSTADVLTTIPVGKRPRGARISPDGSRLFVALSGSPKSPPGTDESELPPADRTADGIGVVDVDRLTLIGTLPSGRDPETFDLTPDGRWMVISNEETAEATVVDVAEGRVLRTIGTGVEPEGVAIRPDGAVAYVTSEAEHSLSVLDLQKGARIATIPTGKRPRAVVFSTDGRRAYVTDELGATVTVVDAVAHQPVLTIPIGNDARPMGVRITPDGTRLIVTNGRAASISIISVEKGVVESTITGVSGRPWGVDVTRDGKRAFVACGPLNDIAVIDIPSGAVERRVTVGRSPWGVVIEPKPRPA